MAVALKQWVSLPKKSLDISSSFTVPYCGTISSHSQYVGAEHKNTCKIRAFFSVEVGEPQAAFSELMPVNKF